MLPKNILSLKFQVMEAGVVQERDLWTQFDAI